MSSRSTLPSAILALLSEGPKHPYRIQQCIRERRQHEVINVSQRASLYQAIRRLEREGLIRVQSVSRDEKRPERTTYELTDAGQANVASWLRNGLSSPLREFPEFPAVLSFIDHLTPEEAALALRQRIVALAAEDERLGRDYETAIKHGVARLFLVESEYLRAVYQAEKAWIETVVRDIEAGTLFWTPESIKAIRAGLSETHD